MKCPKCASAVRAVTSKQLGQNLPHIILKPIWLVGVEVRDIVISAGSSYFLEPPPPPLKYAGCAPGKRCIIRFGITPDSIAPEADAVTYYSAIWAVKFILRRAMSHQLADRAIHCRGKTRAHWCFSLPPCLSLYVFSIDFIAFGCLDSFFCSRFGQITRIRPQVLRNSATIYFSNSEEAALAKEKGKVGY